MTGQSENMNSNGIAALQMKFAEALRNRETGSLAEFVSSLDAKLSVKDLARLIGVEVEFRRLQGESVKLSDYVEQFPELVGVENEQSITEVMHESTAVGTEIIVDHPSLRTRQVMNPGETIDDFELLAQLGRGSFATVFLARQISMQRLVALKVSTDHGMEAQTLAQLDHPYIVRVFDQRKARDYNLQLLYMQYLEGGTLLDAAQKIFNQGTLPVLDGKVLVQCIDQAVTQRGSSPNYEASSRRSFIESNWDQTICRIGYHLAQALEYAHRKGVLHRDIKPANVLIGADCGMKLADFNISSSQTVVGKGSFGGSLAYMSPEQIRAFNSADQYNAEQLDARCDIYSLGVMLIQLLKGNLPFSNFSKSRSGEGLEAMVFEREHAGQRVAAMLVGHSPLLQTALAKCVAPNRDDRYASAHELATQLRIGLDRQAEQLLYPARKNWTNVFRPHFYLVCIVVALLFNGLAALFVFNFNLFDAVPETAHDRFWIVQSGVNGIAFPLAIALFAWLTHPVARAFRLIRCGDRLEVAELKLAVRRCLAAGHIQATICGAEWLVAGIAYPVVLTLAGVVLHLNDWVDFIASHTLAGIAITTLTFFAMTYLTLRIWFPVLVQKSLAKEVTGATVTGLQSLIRKVSLYQLLAVSVPLLAIALLVIFGDVMARSKFALTVISLFGLLTIPIVLFGGNLIRAICERLLLVFRDDD